MQKRNVMLFIPKRQFWAEFTVSGKFCWYVDEDRGENTYEIIGHSRMGKHQFVVLAPWEESDYASRA